MVDEKLVWLNHDKMQISHIDLSTGSVTTGIIVKNDAEPRCFTVRELFYNMAEEFLHSE